jgi:hypothetical protein
MAQTKNPLPVVADNGSILINLIYRIYIISMKLFYMSLFLELIFYKSDDCHKNTAADTGSQNISEY